MDGSEEPRQSSITTCKLQPEEQREVQPNRLGFGSGHLREETGRWMEDTGRDSTACTE